jgi:uncharacterized protein
MIRTLWCLLAAIAIAPAASAIDVTALKPEGYLSDFARVVDPASKANIENYCARVEKATGVQIALVTIDTLGGEPVEDVANSLFHRWGIGNKKTDEGVLFLLVIRDRRSRLEVGRGLEPIITDADAGAVLRQMKPSLQNRQYGDALLAAAQSLAEQIAKAKNVTIPEAGIPRVATRPSPSHVDIPWPVIIFGLFLLFWIIGRIGRGGGGRRGGYGGGGGGFLPGLILGNVLGGGRSWGGYSGSSGGGFGGYDSGGGGFGGFGGGDSGGGGASGSW